MPDKPVILSPTSHHTPALESIGKVKQVIVASDLLRIDDRLQDRLSPPAAINTNWIFQLFSPLLGNVLGVPTMPIIEFPYPDRLSRISVYRKLGREFSSSGWASLYDDLGDPATSDELIQRMDNSLVLSYEMPPYLQKLLNRARIPFIDLVIHPIRFLPDYIFGIRSNVRNVTDAIIECALPDELVRDFARLSAARTARTHRAAEPLPGSAVFFGQIGVDSSLITAGRLATMADVEDALAELALDYPVVYYKPHPHVENPDQLKTRLEKVSKLKWVTWNSYDLLALSRVGLFASLSSGVLYEANYFTAPTRRFLPPRDLFALAGDSRERIDSGQLYVTSPPAIFREPFWAFLLGKSQSKPILELPTVTSAALKFSLNMQWGR